MKLSLKRLSKTMSKKQNAKDDHMVSGLGKDYSSSLCVIGGLNEGLWEEILWRFFFSFLSSGQNAETESLVILNKVFNRNCTIHYSQGMIRSLFLLPKNLRKAVIQLL